MLTTEAFRQSLTLDSGHDLLTLPRPVLEALHQVIERYGDAPLAVRSSSLAEDLPDATFAGQYETVLDVRGLAALDEAVRRCWASTASLEATAYRSRSNAAAGEAMAVLVQPMLESEAAGVALGADPITGERSKTIVSAVRGRGAALVSGNAVAEDWEVTPAATVAGQPTGRPSPRSRRQLSRRCYGGSRNSLARRRIWSGRSLATLSWSCKPAR